MPCSTDNKVTRTLDAFIDASQKQLMKSAEWWPLLDTTNAVIESYYIIYDTLIKYDMFNTTGPLQHLSQYVTTLNKDQESFDPELLVMRLYDQKCPTGIDNLGNDLLYVYVLSIIADMGYLAAYHSDPDGCYGFESVWVNEIGQCVGYFEAGKAMDQVSGMNCVNKLDDFSTTCSEDILRCGCFFAGHFFERMNKTTVDLAQAASSYRSNLYAFTGTNDTDSTKLQYISDHHGCLNIIDNLARQTTLLQQVAGYSANLNTVPVSTSQFINFIDDLSSVYWDYTLREGTLENVGVVCVLLQHSGDMNRLITANRFCTFMKNKRKIMQISDVLNT